MTRKRTREIHVGVDVATDHPYAWRLVAECDDEITTIVMIGRQWAPIVAGMTEDGTLAGGLGAQLVLDHQARCGSCQAWARGRVA